MAAHVQQPPKPPIEVRSNLSAALNEIILTAIAKDPAQRFQSANAFRNALSSVRGALPADLPANQNVSPARLSSVSATALLQSAVPAASILGASTAPFEAPPAQPPIPSVLEMSAQQKNHRGLYMSLGALIVLAVLVVAGLYIPRRAKTSANEHAAPQATPAAPSSETSSGNSAAGDAAKAQPADATGSSPQNSEGANPSANPSSRETQSFATPGSPAKSAGDSGATAITKRAAQIQQVPMQDDQKPVKKDNPHKNLKVAPTADPVTRDVVAVQNSPTQSTNPAQLEALEQQADQLSSQASSVNDSLDNLRRQQNAQGLSLRGDIGSAQELMKSHMAKAQAALQNGDSAGAKKYLDLAEGDVARLDKFLGR
jgi:serine/threonine-protein kinase